MKTVSGWFLAFVLFCPTVLLYPTALEAQPALKAAPAAKVAKPAPAASQPVLPPVPTDGAGAIAVAGEAAKAAAGKQWWYLSALVVLLAMFGLKVSGLLGKMGRWKYVVPAVLALGAGLLSAAQGGLSWSEAVGVFTATWATGQLQQLVEHGILGKPHTAAGGEG